MHVLTLVKVEIVDYRRLEFLVRRESNGDQAAMYAIFSFVLEAELADVSLPTAQPLGTDA